jgi:hypothetical protein
MKAVSKCAHAWIFFKQSALLYNRFIAKCLEIVIFSNRLGLGCNRFSVLFNISAHFSCAIHEISLDRGNNEIVYSFWNMKCMFPT